MNGLTLALEPHAASFYCQNSYGAFQNVVEDGGKYIVADLGGIICSSKIIVMHIYYCIL